MTPDEMKKRTREFALRIIRLAEELPNTRTGRVVAGQILRAGTSVGANYRAACNARSQADFIAKMGIVQEEADETICWMELVEEAKLIERRRLAPLMREAGEILAIAVSSINTARGNRRRRKANATGASGNPKSTICNTQ
jgi:four helix bundle protein